MTTTQIHVFCAECGYPAVPLAHYCTAWNGPLCQRCADQHRDQRSIDESHAPLAGRDAKDK